MIIDLKNIYWEREGEYILKDISWQVREGEHWALFGLNGSGKTSLLNLVCGYIYPTTGEAAVLGRTFGESVLQDIREEIGLVSSSLQEQMYQSETAKEIVLSGRFATIGLSIHARPNKEDEKRAEELLEKLDCAYLGDRPYRTFSEGERKKVVIARSLMNNPRLLILDEPCTGLDIVSREQVLDSVARLAAEPDAPTLIYVTHTPDELLPFISKTLLLKEGRVYAAGETREIMASQAMSDFLGLQIEVDWANDRPYFKLLERREVL